MSEIKVLGGKPDMTKLARSGRIKLKPNGDVEGQPINPILYVEKRQVKNEGGFVMGTVDIPVNGGHAKLEGSVWRSALNGPKDYQVMILEDKKMRLRKHDAYARGSAPILTNEEADEYLEYEEYLKEKGVEIAENADFYAWKTGEKKKKA